MKVKVQLDFFQIRHPGGVYYEARREAVIISLPDTEISAPACLDHPELWPGSVKMWL